MSKQVQSVRPVPNAVIYEGLLDADSPKQMVARSDRGQGFQQVLISAEARSRVELWREYTPPAGVNFSAVHYGGAGWLVGDEEGNLHVSADGLTWTIVKKFGAEVTGIQYDGQIEPWTWVCTEGGELWQGSQEYETGVWTWTLAYSDPSLNFVGVGMSDERVVVVIRNSKDILRSTDANGAPWTIATVWPTTLYNPFGCTSELGLGPLWVESYTSKPYYTTDGGLTWTQTPAAAGNAVASIGVFDGVVVAGGPGGLWRTDDAGVTWTTVKSDPSTFFYVAGGVSGWFAINAGGEVFTSTDAGLTWTSTGQRGVGDGDWAARPVGIAVNQENAQREIVAVCNGGVLVSMDTGATWKAGAGGEAWRISVEAYQPVLFDLPYEIPANERLVGTASEETFVLVGG